MFSKSAPFYDAIYSFKDYAAEGIEVQDLIRKRNPEAKTLLDVACGTGLHLQHLAGAFDVTGLDLDPELLKVARERVPEVPLHEGDMRNFDLGERFDAVTCLFSSIGYVGGPDELAQAFGSFAEHLNPGGVVVVEGWFTPDEWDENHIGSVFVDKPDLKVARMNLATTRGRVSAMDLHYLVGTLEGIEHFVEPRQLYLFTPEEYIAAMVAAGLKAEHDADALMGRGVYIGVKS
jgi:SAM-dependent methyltransferase